MDNIILEVITKQGLQVKNPNEFINYLRTQENNPDNNKIIEKMRKERFSKKQYQEYVAKLQSLNKNDYDMYFQSQKVLMSDLKKNIINFISSLINIYNYKNQMIKRIGIPDLARAYMPPIEWKDLSGFQNLEKIFGKPEINKNSRNNPPKPNFETIIFKRVLEVIAGKESWEALKNLKLSYNTAKNRDKTLCKNNSNDLENWERINNVSSTQFTELNQFIFDSDGNVSLVMSEEHINDPEKKIFLFFILALEITYNILATKGEFTLFTNIYSTDEFYKTMNNFFKQSSKKQQGKQGKQGKQKKKQKKKKGQKGGQVPEEFAEALQENFKKNEKSSKGKYKNNQNGKKKGQKQQVSANLAKYYDIAKKIDIDDNKLTKIIGRINVSSYTLYDYSNNNINIYDNVVKLNSIYDNDMGPKDESHGTSPVLTYLGNKDKNQKKQIKNELEKYNKILKPFCQKSIEQSGGENPKKPKKGQQGKKGKQDKQGKNKKTLNVFNIIFSFNNDPKVEGDYMVNGTYKGIQSFLLPYDVDREGEDVINYLDGYLDKKKTKDIINDVFNLYMGILYARLKYIVEIYDNIKRTALIQSIIKNDPKLDLFTIVVQNKNNKNKNKRNNTVINNGPLVVNNNQLRRDEIRANIIRLESIKNELNSQKLKYTHNNMINNKTRNLAIKEIDKRIDEIINKLRNARNRA